jgi:hypothetical protein
MRRSARWNAVAGGAGGNRRDNATSAGPRCGDASKSESRSRRSKRRTLEDGDRIPESSPAPLDIAGQAVWRDPPSANPRETRNISQWRWQKSQILGYTRDTMHILVLPHRSECFEGQGEVFSALATEIGANRPHDRFTPSRSPSPFLLPEQRRSAARYILKSLLERRMPLLLSK